MIRALLLPMLLLGFLLPTAAKAEWREATSEHFIVYSQASEAKLREAITRLEKYDHVLRVVTATKKPSSPIKLKVYTVADMDEVQRTLPAGGEGIAGYYNASSRGPFAVIPQSAPDDELSAESTLFHEYVHHFMFQYFPAAYPTWYSEGFAEYYGSTRFRENDLVEVGNPQRGRYKTMRFESWLPMRKLLTAKSYGDVGDQIYQLYAEGWLLVHYLSGKKERAAQLAKYLNALNAGADFRTAMVEAFGPDARELDHQLEMYSHSRQFETLKLQFRSIDVSPITIRTLGPAEQALLPYEIRLARGLLVREAVPFAEAVRPIAARFPADPYALAMLTEVEHDAGRIEASNAAADRWLAMQPRAARAPMYKALNAIAPLLAVRATDKSAWDAARRTIVQASKLDPRDPMILEAYYDSFAAQGGLPPESAQNALYSAFELAPQVDELRFKLARDFEQRGLIEDAIAIIKPSAYSLSDAEITDPKKKAKRDREWEKWRGVGETKHETARELLARLESKQGSAAPVPAQPVG
jgi:Flp pilus assembly protein TadD